MKRSKHNLSHYKLLTGNMGELLPVGCVEVLPGDTFQHATSMLARATPLMTPPMHPVKMSVHHWYVPTRLLWSDFQDFITGGPDGNDATVHPWIDFEGAPVALGSLANYLGLPENFEGPGSALPFRAYAKIFNEWYRDQDLVAAVTESNDSGADTVTNSLVLSSAWEKDYFTTARLTEQKGDAVTLPLGTSAPVDFSAAVGGVTSNASLNFSGTTGSADVAGVQTNLSGQLTYVGAGIPVAGTANLTGVTGVVADLSSATAVDVNAVREAFALQRYKEARARYGSRYTEYLAYLGVRSSDARLQRPEYLGGGVQTLQFSEILQTAGTTADPDGVGQLYGHGIGSVRSNRYRKFFEEHGFVISIVRILPRTLYANATPRMFLRSIKEDYWQKELEHIGQQVITNREVYGPTGTIDPTAVFGYQDRYDEYRRMESQVVGEFGDTLSDWHFARMFADTPVLNSSFVTSDPAVRPFADQVSNTMLLMVYHQLVARRMVAKVGSSFIF